MTIGGIAGLLCNGPAGALVDWSGWPRLVLALRLAREATAQASRLNAAAIKVRV